MNDNALNINLIDESDNHTSHEVDGDESVTIADDPVSSEGLFSANIRHMTPFALFIEFVLIGCQAFGGPMAQIAMLKHRYVTSEQWMSAEYFNRVQGVYQLIPGPEATELCIYFGILSAGRIGGLIAGFAFVLPGAILMLGLSIVYVHFGINNGYFAASFRAVEPCVAAMMTVAVYRIGQHALVDDGVVSGGLVLLAITSAILSLLHINIVVVLISLAIAYFLHRTKQYIAFALYLVIGITGIVLLFTLGDTLSPSSSAIGIAATATPQSLFGLGFLGGLLSVGGAYSSVPFMQVEAETVGKWITQQQFLDSLALSAVIPAPMVIFSSFIGFIGGKQFHLGMDDLGGEVLGSTLCATGMFLPAFALTISLHKWLEALVHNRSIAALWAGMTAAVVGVVAITAAHFTQTAISADPSSAPLCAVIFVSVLVVLLSVTHPYLMILCITCSAIVGQIWFSPT